MRTQRYRSIISVFQVILLLVILDQCAWFRTEKETEELIKPVPVGGYETLSNRIHYPRAIREAGIEGTVVVNALVSVEGSVAETRIVNPLHAELDHIVTNAVKRTQFEPATRKGKPEQVWISIPFVFALKDWSSRSTPFSKFIMTIYPDPAYRNFEVEVSGKMKDGLLWPIRFECLLPFNAANPWVRTIDGGSPATNIVTDDNGEWLIFQASTDELNFGFTYKAMSKMVDQKFIYEFTMNQPLPDWELHVVYGDQSINFAQTPDRVTQLEDGSTRFEYDLEGQDTYESRFLAIDLQK